VQAFVRLLNYYRKFIEGFSKIAALLTNLTKKDTKFNFNSKCKDTFLKLKDTITYVPILAIYDPTLESFIEMDISDRAIEARLTQKD
jgi:hypothetical protein